MPLLFPLSVSTFAGEVSARRRLMFPSGQRLCASSGPLALAAILALTPGCAVEPEPDGEFVTTRTVRGTLALRYVARTPRVVQVPIVAPSTPSDVWLREELAAARERRRLNALAEQDARRQREEQFRQEQRDISAYQAARQQIVQSQRLEQQARDRDYQERQSRWVEDQRLRAQADAARWAQASKPFEIPPAQDQRQGTSLLQESLGRALRLGQ
jgi:hypothetical protein